MLALRPLYPNKLYMPSFLCFAFQVPQPQVPYHTATVVLPNSTKMGFRHNEKNSVTPRSSYVRNRRTCPTPDHNSFPPMERKGTAALCILCVHTMHSKSNEDAEKKYGTRWCTCLFRHQQPLYSATHPSMFPLTPTVTSVILPHHFWTELLLCR